MSNPPGLEPRSHVPFACLTRTYTFHVHTTPLVWILVVEMLYHRNSKQKRGQDDSCSGLCSMLWVQSFPVQHINMIGAWNVRVHHRKQQHGPAQPCRCTHNYQHASQKQRNALMSRTLYHMTAKKANGTIKKKDHESRRIM